MLRPSMHKIASAYSLNGERQLTCVQPLHPPSTKGQRLPNHFLVEFLRLIFPPMHVQFRDSVGGNVFFVPFPQRPSNDLINFHILDEDLVAVRIRYMLVSKAVLRSSNANRSIFLGVFEHRAENRRKRRVWGVLRFPDHIYYSIHFFPYRQLFHGILRLI